MLPEVTYSCCGTELIEEYLTTPYPTELVKKIIIIIRLLHTYTLYFLFLLCSGAMHIF